MNYGEEATARLPIAVVIAIAVLLNDTADISIEILFGEVFYGRGEGEE